MLLGNSIPEYYTIKEFAEAFNTTEESIKARVNKGTINFYRIGSGNRTTVLIPRTEILCNKKRGRKPKVETSGKSKAHESRKNDII